MKQAIAVAMLALLLGFGWTGPASAKTDSLARNRIKKLDERVEVLENKVTSLQLLVQQLTTRNEQMQSQLESSYTLIKALAKQLNGGQ